MVAAIKQHATVGPDGTIVVRDTALAPGTRAEVIVLVEESASDGAVTPSPASPNLAQLEAFRALQQGMNLDRAAAEKWMAENRELRKWNRPRE